MAHGYICTFKQWPDYHKTTAALTDTVHLGVSVLSHFYPCETQLELYTFRTRILFCAKWEHFGWSSPTQGAHLGQVERCQCPKCFKVEDGKGTGKRTCLDSTKDCSSTRLNTVSSLIYIALKGSCGCGLAAGLTLHSSCTSTRTS